MCCICAKTIVFTNFELRYVGASPFNHLNTMLTEVLYGNPSEVFEGGSVMVVFSCFSENTSDKILNKIVVHSSSIMYNDLTFTPSLHQCKQLESFKQVTLNHVSTYQLR